MVGALTLATAATALLTEALAACALLLQLLFELRLEAAGDRVEPDTAATWLDSGLPVEGTMAGE
jgi:hypothetical protein